jgi:hypothetical protein
MEDARPIETVEHVIAVLESPRFSFDELLLCIPVAAKAGRPELVDRCAVGALTTATGAPARRIPTLLEAARAIVRTRLDGAKTVDDLAPAVDAAESALRAVFARAASTSTQAPLASQLSSLECMRLLIGDPTDASYVSLAKELRKIARPDLARQAASKALNRCPQNVAALRVRAAAASDEGDPDAAVADAHLAWDLEKSGRSARVLSRALLEAGDVPAALDAARCAMEVDDGVRSALVLARAAVAADDDGALADARAVLEDATIVVADAEPRLLPTLAGEALADAGYLDEAERVARRVLAEGRYARAERLCGRIRRARQRQLPLWPPSSEQG